MKHLTILVGLMILASTFTPAEGQTSLQKRTANAESPADSLRIDIAKDDVPYESRRLAGVNYLDTGRADWIDMKPIYQIINQALAKH